MKRVFRYLFIFAAIAAAAVSLGGLGADTASVYATETPKAVIQPRSEETIWYYRVVDGVPQKRLWSITYGKWLTDWMPL